MGGCIMKKGLVLPINISQHIETKPFPNNTLIYSPCQIKEQYYDETFRKISSSVSNQSDRFILGKDYQWKRVSEMQKEFDVGSNITHTDVVQGLLNNHQLLNAFRIVANLQNIIERLFISLDFQPLGRYEVMINTIGIWKVQVIDDFLPFQNENPLFGHSKSKKLWVQLLEKVFAKVYGNYEKLEKSGQTVETVKDLTGAPYIKFLTKEKIMMVQNNQYYYLESSESDIYKIENTQDNIFTLKNLVNDQIHKDNSQEISSNHQYVYYIPFNPKYVLITYLINDINQNEFHRDVVYFKVEENCNTFLTLSQSDLKFNDNVYYAQLSMIIGQLKQGTNEIINVISNKYDQIRDLTIECNLEIGTYLIYYEVYWQKYKDCKLSLQSYGSKQVQFYKTQINDNIKSNILDQLMILHSKTKKQTQIYDNMISRTESQIGRYYYIIYNNDSNDGFLKSILQIQKHQIGVMNLEHQQQTQELIIKPNSQQLLKFIIKLENSENHKFTVTEKDYTLTYPLSDEELIKQTINNPSNIHKRNQTNIYEYKSNDICALVYVNESQQLYKEMLELTLNNLEYKGKKEKVIVQIILEQKQKYLIKLNVIDKQKKSFEYKLKSQFIQE